MSQEFVLRNVSEELVEIHLDDCIKASDICRCERCRADVFAIAVNAMPPKYVVTDAGDLLVRAQSLSRQHKANVIAAITKGIMMVKNGPRHDGSSLDQSFEF